MPRDIKCSAGFCETLDLQHASAPGVSAAQACYCFRMGEGCRPSNRLHPSGADAFTLFPTIYSVVQAPMVVKSRKYTCTHMLNAHAGFSIQLLPYCTI